MYFTRTPIWIRKLFPRLIWQMPEEDKKVYLTFDDGPTPEITEFILDTLDQYDAKATFFCLGKNAERYPILYQRLKDAGHSMGNHTYHHLNGWKTENQRYFLDVQLCAQQVKSKLFRPPYGKITPSQVEYLHKFYQIIMWDVLSVDYDKNVTRNQCYLNIAQNIRPGSIVVLHDSVKAYRNMSYALPKILEEFTAKDYTFAAI